jgi:hypothetical protein
MKIIQSKTTVKNGEIRVKVPEAIQDQEVNLIIMTEDNQEQINDIIRNHSAFLNGYAPKMRDYMIS